MGTKPETGSRGWGTDRGEEVTKRGQGRWEATGRPGKANWRKTPRKSELKCRGPRNRISKAFNQDMENRKANLTKPANRGSLTIHQTITNTKTG